MEWGIEDRKNADAQLGRSFEFSLPKEWSRQEQIDYTTEYIQKTFVDEGMCADWSIHDKGDGNPHVHLLVTMRPFNPDHSWGSKEVKDWDLSEILTEISWLMNPTRTGGRIRKSRPSWNPYSGTWWKRSTESRGKKQKTMEKGSDWRYRLEQSKELWVMAKRMGKDV